jgi:2-iminobutanoate/2-iminopropanoate deaminase
MQIVNTPDAAPAIGPYSQAMKVGGLLITSGQIPLTPAGDFVDGDVDAQTRQVFQNLRAVLAAEGLTLANVAKTTVFMQDLAEFAAMNAVFAEEFGDHKPARSTIQVAGLPKGAKVEIEVIAELG